MEEFISKKIMIVEDNPVNQKVMQRLVKIFGHIPILIEDGFQVMTEVKLQKPEVILMDIQLVGITGIKITQDLKHDDETKHIPVIAVTASATIEDREKIVRESGCNDYLAKPFTPEELSAKIAQFTPVKIINF